MSQPLQHSGKWFLSRSRASASIAVSHLEYVGAHVIPKDVISWYLGDWYAAFSHQLLTHGTSEVLHTFDDVWLRSGITKHPLHLWLRCMRCHAV